MDILLATANPAKYCELRRLLAPLRAGLRNLSEYPHLPDYAEDALTFQENAVGKAKWYAARTGLPTIADDGGLCIDALDGWPGVHSRRIFGDGRRATDDAMIREVLRRMGGIPPDRRSCAMRTVVAFAVPSGFVCFAEGADAGYIAMAPSAPQIPGFPFRSIFVHRDAGVGGADLPDDGNHAMRHRSRAVALLLPQIAAWMANPAHLPT